MAGEEQRFDNFMDREAETLEIMLAASAGRTAITIDEYIKVRVLQGASLESIQADLLTDLNTGGRIFGEFRNSIRATVNGSINRLRDDALFAEQGTITQYRWVAILVNTCPDCLDRHGKSKPWKQWETEGLPRTNHTVCKQNCKCALIPSAVTELENMGPIMRPKR